MSPSTNSRVYSVREAAQLAGVSEWLAGEEIRRTGTLAGVRVLRIGRRTLVPRAAFDQALAGVTTDDGSLNDFPPTTTVGEVSTER